MESFIADMSYLCSDLLSGKSLPLLVAVSTFPVDPNLMATMLFAGCMFGGFLTYVQAQLAFYKRWITLGWFVRLVNHFFSGFMTVMFLFRVYMSMHASGSGLQLGVIPTAIILSMELPNKPSVPLVLLILSMMSLSTSIMHEFDYVARSPAAHHAEHAQLMIAIENQHTVSRTLLAMSQRIHSHLFEYYDTPVHHSVAYSLAICLLSVYATVQHGDVSPGVYISPTYARSGWYASVITCTATLLRTYVYLRVGWIHRNPLHLLFSRDKTYVIPTSGLCGFTQAVVMLFSATWNLSQFMGQMSPVLLYTVERNKKDVMLRLAIFILAFGYWYEWASDVHIFQVAFLVMGFNVIAWALAKLTAV